MQYVEHNGTFSEVEEIGGKVRAQVTGDEIYQIWVEADTVEELAVKFGWALDHVVNK